jgi:hypothetical protein
MSMLMNQIAGLAGATMLLSSTTDARQVQALMGLRSDGDPREAVERFAHQFARGITDSGTQHKDGPSIPFFAEALNYLYSETYREEYVDLPMASGQILPHDSEVPAHAEIWKYRTVQSGGAAKIGNPTGIGSIPRVSIGGREYIGHVATVVNAYGFTLMEMRAIAAVDGSLSALYPEAARRAHDETQEATAWWGNKQHKLTGFLTHPNIPKVYAPLGADASTLWSVKSFDEIVADIVYILNAGKKRTFGREVPTMLLLPRDVEDVFLIKRIPNDKQTLGVHIKELFPGLKILFVDQLNASHPDNTTGVGIAVALRQDKKAAALVTPQPFEQLDPQWHGLEWITICLSRLGGVKVVRPLSATIMPGISAPS